MSFLSGQHLHKVAAQPAQLRQIGATLALTTQALQGFFHASLQQPLAWDLRQLPRLIEYAADLQPIEARVAVEGAARKLKTLLPTLRGSVAARRFTAIVTRRNLLFDAGGERLCGVLDFGAWA